MISENKEVLGENYMSYKYKVLCGVPQEHCSGTKLSTDQNFHTSKCHASHVEAFKCMTKYLVNVLGFIREGSREFIDPETGYIRVLPRQSDFGGHLRAGKLQERYMPDSPKAKTAKSGIFFSK